MFSQFDKQQLYGTQRNVTEFKLSQKNVAGFALAAINAFYIHRKVEQGQCQLNYYNHLQQYMEVHGMSASSLVASVGNRDQ
jgi:hypothetical protein